MRVIDKMVEQWYIDTDSDQKIHDYLGMTHAEYDDFVNNDLVPDRLSDLSKEYQEQKK